MDKTVTYLETMSVACDGGESAFGHPRVCLNLEKTGDIICPYCSHHFILKQTLPGKKKEQ